MIVLYILAGLAALVILVLLMRLRITVSYSKSKESAGSPAVHLGIGPVKLKLYPLCRHEILNEINREQIYEDLLAWMEECIRNLPVLDAEE